MMIDHFYCQLPNRAQIRISGADKNSFLQGLITNDINAVQEGQLLYACLLTPQGKFLHDFFIRMDGERFIIDCEAGDDLSRAQDLYDRLKQYRLRAKVDIALPEAAQVFAVFGAPEQGAQEQNLPLYRDPRHEEMGYRLYGAAPASLEQLAFDAPHSWDERRIRLCVPDGSRDLTIEKSTLDEGNLDQLNAVSYDKGCYVGQELTARMHYRGLGKRHLRSFDRAQGQSLPEDAQIRSSCGDLCIALVKE